jgi:hypothetical protein
MTPRRGTTPRAIIGIDRSQAQLSPGACTLPPRLPSPVGQPEHAIMRAITVVHQTHHPWNLPLATRSGTTRTHTPRSPDILPRPPKRNPAHATDHCWRIG